MTDQSTQPAAAEPQRLAPSRARRLAGSILSWALRLALDLVVLDAAYETWMSPSPIRTWILGATILYVGLTAWVLSQGGRIGGRGWLTDPLAPLFLLLLFLVGATWSADTAVRGVVLFRQPTAVVLSGASLLLVVLATYRLVGPPGPRSWWLKIPLLIVGGYAAAAFALAIRTRTPYVALLAGDGFWATAPVWLRGASLGAFVLLPIAFVREFGMSMVRLTFAGLLRWILLFAVGCWLAINAAGL